MMEVIQGQTLDQQAFTVDDKTFIDCVFTNCILEYSGGPVSFERTMFRGCRYVFLGKAKRTVHFLQGTGLMPHDPSEWGYFSEVVN